MRANGEWAKQMPLVSIEAIPIMMQLQIEQEATERAKSLGLDPQEIRPTGAVIYIHYSLDRDGVRQCLRGAKIYVPDDGYWNGEALDFMLHHELGHALDLANVPRTHSTDEGTVMAELGLVDEYGNLLSTLTLGEDTIKELREGYGGAVVEQEQ
jgi:hypothetical protein